MNCNIQIKKLLKSSKNNPFNAEFVKSWLNQNWNLYIEIADNNSCSNRQSPFPCFCCIRKDDCLFCEIYKDLSIIENYVSLNNKSLIQLEYYKSIKTDNTKVQVWLKQNLDLGLRKLNDFTEINLIRRSFINGKNNISKQFDYIIIYVSLIEFSYNLEFKNLFDHLFFEQKMLKNEYVDYIKQIEQIETN